MAATTLRLATDRPRRGLPRKVVFTVKLLDNIQPPASGRRCVYDRRVPGLTLIVTPSGAKVFYLYRKVNGRPQRIRIGGWPDLKIEAARRIAGKLNADIAAGLDPMENRRKARGTMTLDQLWQHYCEHHVKQRCTAATKVSQRSLYDTCLTGWKNRRLSDIKGHHVAALHAAIGRKRGQVTANRAIQLLKRLYRYATRRLSYEGPHPTASVELFREHSRERFLQPHEVPRLFQAMECEPQVFRDLFSILLLTGARRSNVQAMRWSDIDLDAAKWTIPADQFKAGRKMDVHLAQPVVDILKRRRQQTDSEYVFASRGKCGHVTDPQFCWYRVIRRAGIRDLRLHDLRRSFGSWMAAAGTSLPIIGRSLGHQSQATTAIYARLNFDAVQVSVDTAASALMEAANEHDHDDAESEG